MRIWKELSSRTDKRRRVNDTDACYLKHRDLNHIITMRRSLSVRNRKLISQQRIGGCICVNIESIPGSETNILSIHSRYSWTRMLELYLLQGWSIRNWAVSPPHHRSYPLNYLNSPMYALLAASASSDIFTILDYVSVIDRAYCTR